MKIFPSSSIKKLDAYTIEHEPIASIDLMERAAQALTKAITEQLGHPDNTRHRLCRTGQQWRRRPRRRPHDGGKRIQDRSLSLQPERRTVCPTARPTKNW